MLFLPSKACISFAVNNNDGISEQLQAENLKTEARGHFQVRSPDQPQWASPPLAGETARRAPWAQGKNSEHLLS